MDHDDPTPSLASTEDETPTATPTAADDAYAVEGLRVVAVEDEVLPQPSPDDAEFEVMRGDVVMASAEGPRAEALIEARRLAGVFARRGLIEVYEVRRVRVIVLKEEKV